MKTSSLLLLLCALPLFAISQESVSGIFITTEDFLMNKLSYSVDCNAENFKIRKLDNSSTNYLKVIQGDSTFKLQKKDIFGYRDCKGDSYRFIDGVAYIILNPSEYILIYRFEIPVGHGTNARYLFSRGPSGEVKSLSKENIEHAFPENAEFNRKVALIFGKRLSLATYDKLYGIYILNWVYNNAMNNQTVMTGI